MVPRKWSYGKEIIIRCCSCQKIFTEAGGWQDLEPGRQDQNKTLFSHSVCPACVKELYSEFLPAAGIL
jgi:hypothetical protein